MGMLSAEDVESAVYDKTQELREQVAELEATLYNANLQKGILTLAYILRKQADAVEDLIELYQAKVGNGTYIWKGYAVDQAQRLRQQADELERKQ